MAAPAKRCKNILLIENDPAWQLIVTRAARAVDPTVNVVCCKTFAAAETTIQKGVQFELIVSDIFLNGDLTGIDFWQICQKEKRPIPFMMISSLSEFEYNRVFQDHPFKPPFFSKSLEIESLKYLLNNQLRRPVQPIAMLPYGMQLIFALILLLAASPGTLYAPGTKLLPVQDNSRDPASAKKVAVDSVVERATKIIVEEEKQSLEVEKPETPIKQPNHGQK